MQNLISDKKSLQCLAVELTKLYEAQYNTTDLRQFEYQTSWENSPVRVIRLDSLMGSLADFPTTAKEWVMHKCDNKPHVVQGICYTVEYASNFLQNFKAELATGKYDTCQDKVEGEKIAQDLLQEWNKKSRAFKLKISLGYGDDHFYCGCEFQGDLVAWWDILQFQTNEAFENIF